MNQEATPLDSNGSDKELQEAHQIFDSLVAINEQLMVVGGDATKVSEISQLVMKRGEWLGKAQTIDYSIFDETDRQALGEKLNRYQSLEEEIAQKFKDVMGLIEKQLKSSHKGKQVVAGYKQSTLPKKTNFIGEDA